MSRREEHHTVFHVGSQRARTINNVAGDQTFIDGPGSSITIERARDELGRLRRQVEAIPLSPTVAAAAERELRDVEAQIGDPQPDRGMIAASLRRLTEILQGVGALATAGTTLSTPIETLARWLGAAGVPVLGLLGIV